jgi:hypothetical protein
MEAKDLRIGNLVNIGGQINEIELVDFVDIYENKTIGIYKPIPLTEEWLLKFRFVKKDYGCQIHYYANTKSLWKITFKKDIFKRDKTIIKYVHQLQNLYFALTGQELTLNK